MTQRTYTARTVIAAQRRVLKMAATVLRAEFKGQIRRDRLVAYDGLLITIGEVIEHIDAARRLKVALPEPPR